MSRLLRLACLPLLLSLPTWAQETGAVREVVSDVADSDYARAQDVVILSEGYRADERDEFLATARGKIARAVRTSKAALPLRQASPWNFHYVFVNSADGGAPWRPGFPARDTAFAARVEGDGTLSCDDAEADVVAAELAPDVDLVVVLVKLLPLHESVTIKEQKRLRRLKKKWRPDPVSDDADVAGPDDVRPNADIPGDGGRIRLTTDDVATFVHEVGHAVYDLGDEYPEYEGEIPEEEKVEVAVCANLTCDPSGARWKHIISTSPIEGAGYYQRGVWRPQQHCRMNESRSRDFCPVCVAAITGRVGAVAPREPRLTSPTEGAQLVAPAVTATLHELRLQPRWQQDGAPPVSYHLELRRGGATGRRVWEGDVEGQLRTLALTKRLKTPGSYFVGLRADGAAGSSETVWRRVEVVLGGADGHGGLVGAVDDGH